MAPNSGNQGNKNPHLRLVHGKYRFNANTNVPTGHNSCQVAARAKIDRERDRGVTRVIVRKAKDV